MIFGGIALDDIHCNPFCCFEGCFNDHVAMSSLSRKRFSYFFREHISNSLCVRGIFSRLTGIQQKLSWSWSFCPAYVQLVAFISSRDRLYLLSRVILLSSQVVRESHVPVFIAALGVTRVVLQVASRDLGFSVWSHIFSIWRSFNFQWRDYSVLCG